LQQVEQVTKMATWKWFVVAVAILGQHQLRHGKGGFAKDKKTLQGQL